MDFLAKLQSGDQQSLVMAGAGVAGLLFFLLALALLLPRRKKREAVAGVAPQQGSVDASRRRAAPPPSPTIEPGAPASVARRQIVADLQREDIGSWRHPNNNPTNPIGSIADGVYQFNRNQSARSTASLPAVAGHAYRVHFRAAALADSANGGKNNFFVGPMYLDAEGKVVGWYK